MSVRLDAREGLRRLGELRGRAENMGPMFADVAEQLLESTRDRFFLEEDPDGVRWEDIAESTRARKEAEGLEDGILQATGVMRDTLFSEFGADFALVGSARMQAPFHQFGTDAGLPAREFLGLSVEDVAEIEAIVEDWFGGIER